VTVRAGFLEDHVRDGLRLSGGVRKGDVTSSLAFKARTRGTANVAAGTTWEMARLALPMPTLMPSYNQIGFDSLHYMIGVVEMKNQRGVAWMIGAKLAEGENRTVVDPTTRALFPLEIVHDGDLVTFKSEQTLRVEVMNVVIPFEAFHIAARLDGNGASSGVSRVSGSAKCAGVPFYGPFLQTLGLCNAQTDDMVVVGGAELRAMPKSETSSAANESVKVTRGTDAVEATFAGGGAPVNGAEHVTGILLVDAASGRPVVLDYGVTTERKTDANGNVTSLRVPLAGKTMPGTKMRAHVIVDTRVIATHDLDP
jgi:hypothetical protein